MLTLTIDRRYLLLPVAEDAPLERYWVRTPSAAPFDLMLRLSTKPDFYTWMDVAEFMGQSLRLDGEAPPEAEALISLCDQLPPEMTDRSEKLRPLMHFTPLRGWVNDPNGLYYADGEYHLFYQHNPYDTRWENMHWGHAVSRDLLHWREQPEALRPDETGAMFSGCAVVDHANASGLGKDGQAPVLLFYTAAGGINQASAGKECSVCVAYSTDGGKRFVKYAGNPVLAPYVHDNRDPKVFFCAQSNRYCMVLYLEAHRFGFFSSADLIHWRYESEVDLPTLNECPDVFPLPGDEAGRWALLAGADLHWQGSVGKYYIGAFDGHCFTAAEGPYAIDEGRDMYSLQTFDNAPDERRILIGWRSRRFDGTGFEGMPFNGEFTTPVELFGFREADGSARMGKYPVREILRHMRENAVVRLSNERLDGAGKLDALQGAQGVVLSLELDRSEAAFVTLSLGGERVVIDLERGEISCLERTLRLPDGAQTLRLLAVRDKTSLEIYAQDGRYSASGYCAADNGAYAMEANGAPVQIRSLWAGAMATRA